MFAVSEPYVVWPQRLHRYLCFVVSEPWSVGHGMGDKYGARARAVDYGTAPGPRGQQRLPADDGRQGHAPHHNAMPSGGVPDGTPHLPFQVPGLRCPDRAGLQWPAHVEDDGRAAPDIPAGERRAA